MSVGLILTDSVSDVSVPVPPSPASTLRALPPPVNTQLVSPPTANTPLVVQLVAMAFL